MIARTGNEVETRLKSLQDTVEQLRLALQDVQSRGRSLETSPKSDAQFESRPESLQSTTERVSTDWHRKFELEKLKVQERDLQLRAYDKMAGMVSALQQAISEIRDEKHLLENEISRLRRGEQQNEGLKRQMLALQTTLGQKERLLSEIDIERTELKERNLDLMRKTEDLESEMLTFSGNRRRTTPESMTSQENSNLAEQLQVAEAEIERLTAENETLSNKLHDISIDRCDDILPSDQPLQDKVLTLEKDVENLCAERERLLMLLNEQENEEVQDLKTQLREKELVIEAFRNPPGGDALTVVAELIGVSIEEVEPAVKELLQELRYRRIAALTIERIGTLMQECAMSQGPPTMKQVWRWVRRITEEFMTVTVHYKNLSELVKEVCKELGVQSPKEVRRTLAEMLKELRESKQDVQ